MVQQEYARHPRWGEGPWLLCAEGTRPRLGGPARRVRAERCPIGARLVAEFDADDLHVTQETLLWDGADRVEFRTHVDGSIGQDRLLRVRFPARVPGGLPVYQTAVAVIGRSPGSADTDVAEHEFTLDNPPTSGSAVGSTARVAVAGPAGERRMHAIGVAEVIVPEIPDGCREPARDLHGGTGPRGGHGDLLAAGRPALRFDRRGLQPPRRPPRAWAARPRIRSPPRCSPLPGPLPPPRWQGRLAADGQAMVWVPGRQTLQDAFAPGADLRGAADLPVLIVAGRDLPAAIAAADRGPGRRGDRGSRRRGPGGGAGELGGHSVALLNRGTPGSLVTPDGTLTISLMRSCSSWPCGVWIDGDKRTAPDGSSFAWQHWSHTFEYALAAGPGDWRSAGFPLAGAGLQPRPAGLRDRAARAGRSRLRRAWPPPSRTPPWCPR